MTISDQTGKQWVTAFNDQAVPLLDNKTADELQRMKDGGEVRRRECMSFLMSLVACTPAGRSARMMGPFRS